MLINCTECNEPADEKEGFHQDGNGRRRSICKKCNNKRTRELRARGLANTRIEPKKSSGEPVPTQPIKQKAPKSKTYVITYAQNATPIHEGFLQALQVYCEKNKAALLVIPGRYKNPTSIWSSKMEHDEWWDERLHPYLFNGRMLLGENIGVFGDISIQPTAARPLTGFEVFVGKYSGVFGHPRLQFKTVATAHRRYPRILTTTGSVTLDNYTDSKAGKKGQAHHVIGACVVEEEGGLFHVRQINATDDGSFIDLDVEYMPTQTQQAPPAEALVCGDIHDAHRDQAVLDATLYAPDSIAYTIRPKKIVYGDALDFDVRNHHTINDFFDRYDRVKGHMPDLVHKEVEDVIEFVDRTPPFSKPFIIASNHDEAIDKWLKTADPRQDPINARFFHATWTILLDHKDKTGEWKPAFELWYEKLSKTKRAKFVRRDESFTVADIALGFHGDIGLNGARGSPAAYVALGVKTVTGHGHAPSITDGAVVVGVTGALDQRYNHLPSGWLNTHCIVYANSKRCLVSVIDGKWRARRK